MTRTSPRSPGTQGLAKLTPPTLPLVLERERLYRQLDRACRTSRVIWITGAPGVGKTTLAAAYLRSRRLRPIWYNIDERDTDPATFFHYLGLAALQATAQPSQALPHLAPEFLLGLPTFTRNFFDALFARMKKTHVLVFDDYHEISRDSPIHDLISAGMNCVPNGFLTMIIGREAPPQNYSRLQVNRIMQAVEGEALQLTEKEARGIIELWDKREHRRFSSRDIRAMYDRVHGWTAGLVLMLEQLKEAHVDPAEWQHSAPEIVFDYLASQTMKRLNEEVQTLLLKTALFPAFTASMAQAITDNVRAEEVLDGLYRGRYFTERRVEREVFYGYHPLFREFLKKAAHEKYTETELRSLRRQTAALLANASRPEDAIELLEAAGEVDEKIRIVLDVAPQMFAQGRMMTVQEWLTRLPEESITNNPWLLFWKASCQFPFSAQEARETFLRSYELFEQSHDRVGQALACCGILESYLYTYGHINEAVPWVERVKQLVPDDFAFPPEIEARILFDSFTAFMWCRPQDPMLSVWEKRIVSLLPHIPDPGRRGFVALQLATFHYWKGDFDESWKVVKTLDRTSEPANLPLFWLPIYLAEACLGWCTGSLTQTLNSIENGLALSQSSGITHFVPFFLGQGVFASLIFGNVLEGKTFLAELRKTPHQGGLAGMPVHFLSAWIAHLLGHNEEALSHIESSMKISKETAAWFPEGLDHIVAAQIFCAKGDLDEGEKHLGRAREIGRLAESKTLQFQSLLTMSQFELHRGNEAKAVDYLRTGLPLGRMSNSRYMPGWRAQEATRVFSTALKAGVEVEYVSELIRDFNLKPEGLAVLNLAWPWPVKIVTLGRFLVMVDGKPISFSRKSPHRLFELLKAFIALAVNGEVSEQRLVDSLWPEAEGDRGHAALKKNLQRLQKLLGNEAIEAKGSTVCINEDVCWVDAFAFDQATKILEPSRLHDDRSWSQLADTALLLYQGPFLPADQDKPWTFLLRDRLRHRAIDIAKRLKTLSDLPHSIVQDHNNHLMRITESDPGPQKYP